MSRQTAIQTTNANDIQVRSQPHVQPEQPWSYIPAMDVVETEHEYSIVLDAPGLVSENITLALEAG